MKISVKKNKWTNLDYPEEWNDEDFYVYLSPNAEIQDPLRNIYYRQTESVGCFLLAMSAHEYNPNFEGTLGFPHFSDDCIVFKNTQIGKEAYREFMEKGNITQICANKKIFPIIYPGNIINIHIDQALKPTIVWGKEND